MPHPVTRAPDSTCTDRLVAASRLSPALPAVAGGVDADDGGVAR